MKKYFALVGLVLCLGLIVNITGCNTVAGIGEDIQSMGRGLSGAAE